MYIGLLHTHSLLRWIALALLVVTVIKALVGWFGNKPYGKIDDKLALFTLIAVHLQLVIGLVLYFISPTVKVALNDMGAAMKDANLRYWAVEHLTMMLLGIILITVGRVRSKKFTADLPRFRTIGIFYTIGLICILSRIPWDRGFISL